MLTYRHCRLISTRYLFWPRLRLVRSIKSFLCPTDTRQLDIAQAGLLEKLRTFNKRRMQWSVNALCSFLVFVLIVNKKWWKWLVHLLRGRKRGEIAGDIYHRMRILKIKGVNYPSCHYLEDVNQNPHYVHPSPPSPDPAEDTESCRLHLSRQIWARSQKVGDSRCQSQQWSERKSANSPTEKDVSGRVLLCLAPCSWALVTSTSIWQHCPINWQYNQ